MKCPYCNSKVELKDSYIVYGKDYGLLYICSKYPKCDAFMAYNPKNKHGFGRLANKELRELRKQAHKYFDGLWQYKNKITGKNNRKKAYKWLSEQMNIPEKLTHIAMFNNEQCKKVIEICKKYYKVR
jgi:hypothetical protein